MVEEIHILLVEDNPGDARLIEEMLINSTYEDVRLDPVTTLAEAHGRLADNDYTAVLLDLTLPDSHGIDTLLKMAPGESDTPIIVLTGIEDEDLGVEAVQLGAQDYLSKGDVDDRLLVRSIRYAIERHRTEAALRRSESEYRSLIDDVFDTSMVGVLILDSDFDVVWCNEATEVYFGIERERLLGRDKRTLIDDDLKCIFADPEDYSTRLLKAYDEMSFTDRFECQVMPEGDREERWLEHWSQPIRDGIYKGGRIEQYTDITDRKKLEFAEREQRESVEALRDIGTLLTSSLELNEVLGRILDNLERVVPHNSALISIMQDDHFQIARHDSVNKRDTQEIRAERSVQIAYKALANVMLETKQPLIIDDLHQDMRVSTTVPEDIHAFVGVPIQLKDEVIGFINLLGEERGYFKDTHAVQLSSFAKLAAIAIENARLYDQSRELAALQERQRLARELHDSVSQTLFTCRTMSESAIRRWDKDPARSRELIEDINQLTTTALAEMRILLLELRPKSLTDIGLKQLFEQYLQPIQDRRKFELNLDIADMAPLPPDVQIALYRITQEALNKIDKHAQASLVEVDARGDADQVMLRIKDNGRGFKPDTVTSTSLGLSIMRERAQEIGARISIRSEMSTGTEIQVEWNRE